MWAASARQLTDLIASGVLYVEVRRPDQEISIGTAFHIGGGYCVTARHVIEGNTILRIGRRDTSLSTQFHPAGGHPVRTTRHGAHVWQVSDDRYNHPDARVDVSIIRLLGPNAHLVQPFLQLSPTADVYSEGEFLMKEVVVLGYPPVPSSSDAHLVVFRGEVSAVIENRDNQRRQFVISGMARGGFSGGPVVSVEAPNVVLGVVVESLMRNTEIEELGFIGATTITTAFEIADRHHLDIRELQMTRQGFIIGQ